MSNTGTGSAKTEKVWQLAEAVTTVDCAVVSLEEMLGLTQEEGEGPKEPIHDDLPRRLDQLVGWLEDAGRRAGRIVEAVAGLKKTVN